MYLRPLSRRLAVLLSSVEDSIEATGLTFKAVILGESSLG